MRYDKNVNWFEMWLQDKHSILYCMKSNMQADLNVGYDPRGKSITEQREMIDNYIKDINDTLDLFKTMKDENDVNKWCFYDMVKRGAID